MLHPSQRSRFTFGWPGGACNSCRKMAGQSRAVGKARRGRDHGQRPWGPHSLEQNRASSEPPETPESTGDSYRTLCNYVGLGSHPDGYEVTAHHLATLCDLLPLPAAPPSFGSGPKRWRRLASSHGRRSEDRVEKGAQQRVSRISLGSSTSKLWGIWDCNCGYSCATPLRNSAAQKHHL